MAFLLRVRGAFLGAYAGGICYPLAFWFCFGLFNAIARFVFGACSEGWRKGVDDALSWPTFTNLIPFIVLASIALLPALAIRGLINAWGFKDYNDSAESVLSRILGGLTAGAIGAMGGAIIGFTWLESQEDLAPVAAVVPVVSGLFFALLYGTFGAVLPLEPPK